MPFLSSLEFLDNFEKAHKHANYAVPSFKVIHFVLFLLQGYYKICRREAPSTFIHFYMIVIHIGILIYPKDSDEYGLIFRDPGKRRRRKKKGPWMAIVTIDILLYGMINGVMTVQNSVRLST